MLHSPLTDSTFAAGQSPLTTDRFLGGVARVLDAGVIVLCQVIAVLAWTHGWSVKYTVAALLAIVAFFMFAGFANLYRPGMGESLSRPVSTMLAAWMGAVFVLLVSAYLSKTTSDFSRVAVTAWIISTPVALAGWRVIARGLLARLIKREGHRRNVFVWGRGHVADHLVASIRQSPWLGLSLIGYLRPHDRTGDDDRCVKVPVGSGADVETERLENAELEEIERRARRGDFSILYITRRGLSEARVSDLMERLSDTTVSVYLVPDFFTSVLVHGRWSSLNGIPLISVFDTPFMGAEGGLKRIEDIFFSIMILTIVAVPMLLIAALTKLTSRGPVIFRQRRYGIGGKPIVVLKFRTMTVCEDGATIAQATASDPRVTRFGRFLRKTSLDELPQFINVLRGEMSIVGPRPHAVAHNEFYRRRVKGYMVRHKVKPGITGWAQVNGWRGETDDIQKMEKRIEYDLWYIRNWSFWLDIKIILMTVVQGLTGAHVY